MATVKHYDIDLSENCIPLSLLETLLTDRTTGGRIYWACHDYEELGAGYGYYDPITPDVVTGSQGRVIVPRVRKEAELRRLRTYTKAEIFTPAFVCDEMCRVVEKESLAPGSAFTYRRGDSWSVSQEPVRFAEGVTWEDYVRRTCLEITCGEAPFLVSRYDASSGDAIPLHRRIGLLDRKIRIVTERVTNREDWDRWVAEAFRSCYGYEWQGDNILLARENLFYSYIEYYTARWGIAPPLDRQAEIAEIVSWNLFQMDGLRMVIPGSCREVTEVRPGLFGGEVVQTPCPGCAEDDPFRHNGLYARIMDWETGHPIPFIDLYRSSKH